MQSYKTDYYEVTWEDDEATRNAVFNRVLDWYVKMESFNGESIMQCDEPQIEAAPLLAELADKFFKFKTEWK